MVLNFDKKGYDQQTAVTALFGQLAFSGFSRGLSLNVQVKKITEKYITVETYIANTKFIDAKASVYMYLIDNCNGATKEEKVNWEQFGANAIKYEYILTITKATPIQGGQYNYELRLEIKNKRSNLCRV